ncbi:IGF-like family receptor 1 isoform X2 [Mirounga leonina]|uniref:IGF-like family receptor 1 isoform X2 n=1 Tax=Mirounga leonina TaxID=9715 RepID=UPI00156C38D0|nr:IGF-like family receptor 1 isoform X2 [Mirounga leonina]
MPPHHCFLLPGFPGKCDGSAVVGSPAVTAPQAADPARMGPLCLLLTAALLLAQAAPRGASQHCGRLEYWNPDNWCCGSCLQRFGPPPCPDPVSHQTKFSENCGLNDSGDHVSRPFKECPIGQCNPDNAELCSPCGGGATAPAPAGSRSGTQRRCRERSVPPKEPCPLKSGRPTVLSSQEPSLLWTSERKVAQQALPNFALPVVLVLLVLVLLVTSAVILLLAQRCHRQAKVVLHPYPGLACGDTDIHTLFPVHSSSSGSREASEAGGPLKEAALVPLVGRELPKLASQPLCCLLEELIVLLDPEPGPGRGMACGTTRHLAVRYSLPAAWSTFAYSLRPSHSPLRALVAIVVAREPSASLGQLGTHLAQLGWADALQVLSKLG